MGVTAALTAAAMREPHQPTSPRTTQQLRDGELPLVPVCAPGTPTANDVWAATLAAAGFAPAAPAAAPVFRGAGVPAPCPQFAVTGLAPGFRLGQGMAFRRYTNSYEQFYDPMLGHPLAGRFSLQRFDYRAQYTFNGAAVLLDPLTTLRRALLDLEKRVPACLYHPTWARDRQAWGVRVMRTLRVADMAAALVLLMEGIKPVVRAGVGGFFFSFFHFFLAGRRQGR